MRLVTGLIRVIEPIALQQSSCAIGRHGLLYVKYKSKNESPMKSCVHERRNSPDFQRSPIRVNKASTSAQ